MPRLNPYDLAVKANESEETRTFHENGVDLTVTLRRSKDVTRQYRAADKAEDYITRYVTGKPLIDDAGNAILGPDKRPVVAPDTMRAVDGRVPEVSERLCYNLAQLEARQVPSVGEERYTFEEWAAFCVAMPDTMRQVLEWSNGLLVEDVKRPNDSGSEAASLSEPASSPA